MREDLFIAQLIQAQPGLRTWLRAVVGSASAADDCFQEAAVVMSRKRAELPDDANFVGWARTVCGFIVRDHRKRQARSRLCPLPDAALQVLAAVHADDDDAGGVWEARRRALRGCVGDLPATQRDLLHRRYEAEEDVADIATALGRQRGAIDTMLCRLRAALADCIQTRLRVSGEA